MDAIITQEYPYSSLEDSSPELLSFLRQCLDKDIKKRMTTEAMLEHPFIRRHQKSKP